MKSRFLGVAILLWMCAGTLIFLKPNRLGVRAARTPGSQKEETIKQKSPAAEENKKSSPRKGADPVLEKSEVQIAHSDSVNEFANKKEKAFFNSFSSVQQKVMLKATDKQLKKELLSNKEALLSAKKLLLQPALEPEDQVLQNIALDYLFESLKGPQSAAAIEALKSIVADKTVESNKIKIEERKALAGVKAEILYQLSSERPEEAGSLQASLPGPISQKIWRNVQSQQENNLAESRQIKDQRP